MSKVYIGIDNGVSGSIGVIGEWTLFTPMFTKTEQSYTKKKANISRVDFPKLKEFMEQFEEYEVHVMLERPMINPKMFKTSMSAMRALEATLCVLEDLGYAIEYLDSKAWQKDLLPQGVKGSEHLKKASHDIGCRLFPGHKDIIAKQKDADGILIAEYCRRFYK